MALQVFPPDFDSAELDKNDTNSTAPTTARQDDGYNLSAEPPSSEHNFVFARLWRAIKSLFEKPVKDFEASRVYSQGEWIIEGTDVLKAKIDFTAGGSFVAGDWEEAFLSGVETVNGDSGPDVVLDATDFSDINSITEDDLRRLRPYNGLPNSDFEIWNEGTLFAAIAPGTHFAEIYRYLDTTTAVHQIQRTTDVPTFSESDVNSTFSPEVEVTTTAGAPGASEFTLIQHLFEGFDIKDWLGRNIAISFWVKSSVTGIYCLSLRNENADRTFVKEYTIDVADTWERKEIPLFFDPAGTWNISGGTGLVVNWALAVGADFQAPSDGAWHANNFIGTSNQINFNNVINSTFKMTLPQIDLGLTDPVPRRIFNKLPIDKDVAFMRKFLQSHTDIEYEAQKDGPSAPFKWHMILPVPMQRIPDIISSNITLVNAGTTTFTNISSGGVTIGVLSTGGASSVNLSIKLDLKFDARLT